MAKSNATKNTATKAAAKKATATKQQIVRKNRAPAAVAASPDQPTALPPGVKTALYEVLAPFKFGNRGVKPPQFVELTEDEALEYQEAGVLGTDPWEDLPDHIQGASAVSQTAGGGDGAAAGQGTDGADTPQE